ncbi:hypothetical protein B0H11DRAFT_1932718 [Mycena galericulata]|nr:hypothetical protein B0H11DRAFT_1932718 [Mycena galericulata]
MREWDSGERQWRVSLPRDVFRYAHSGEQIQANPQTKPHAFRRRESAFGRRVCGCENCVRGDGGLAREGPRGLMCEMAVQTVFPFLIDFQALADVHFGGSPVTWGSAPGASERVRSPLSCKTPPVAVPIWQDNDKTDFIWVSPPSVPGVIPVPIVNFQPLTRSASGTELWRRCDLLKSWYSSLSDSSLTGNIEVPTLPSKVLQPQSPNLANPKGRLDLLERTAGIHPSERWNANLFGGDNFGGPQHSQWMILSQQDLKTLTEITHSEYEALKSRRVDDLCSMPCLSHPPHYAHTYTRADCRAVTGSLRAISMRLISINVCAGGFGPGNSHATATATTLSPRI